MKKSFRDAFAGTKGSARSFCLSLCFLLLLAEVKNPQRTVHIAGPLIIVVVTVLYVLANIAYFAGAMKEEITGSGRCALFLFFSCTSLTLSPPT